MAIHVSSLADMPAAVSEYRVGALVSILQGEFQPPRPRQIAPARHHRCAVNDIEVASEGEVLASAAHIRDLVAFLREWNGATPLLAHCLAGVSRSTAVALIAHAMLSGDAAASAAVLRRAMSYAIPNKHIVALADAELGFDGALSRAREAMGPPDFNKPPHHVATLPLP